MTEFRAPSVSESSDQDQFVDTDTIMDLQAAMAEITRLQTLIQTGQSSRIRNNMTAKT